MIELKPQFNQKLQRRRRYTNITKGSLYPEYYGRWKPSGRGWTWKKLFKDKSASEVAWRQFQQEQERASINGVDEKTERIRSHTLTQLLDLYRAQQQSQRLDEDHIDVTYGMLKRFIESSGWRTYRDIRVADVNEFLAKPENMHWAVGYRIDWIKKIKAFVNWLRPRGQPHPLEDLKRPSRKNALQRKARRVASANEVAILLSEDLPPQRRLAYALALLNGLRRGEGTRLRWGHVDLASSPPIFKIPPKRPDAQREFDHIPIHPLVEMLLCELAPGDATDRVLPSIPDCETIARDLERAGFTYKDEQGRLLCYHAMRHTFKHDLEKAGAPPTPVRQLMRHQPTSVTDTYGQSELRELRGYLERLHVPPAAPETPAQSQRIDDEADCAVKHAGASLEVVLDLLRIVGVEDQRASAGVGAVTEPNGGLSRYMRHGAVFSGPSASSVGDEANVKETLVRWVKALENIGTFRSLSSVDLSSRKRAANVEKSGPGTQAD